jgi:lantibiotic biosynthesis protein
VRPLVAQARAAGELGGWFFLRYLEPGVGGREHLRLRLCATTPGKTAALRRRVQRALAPAREAGVVTAVEEADYFRETARYGGPQAMAAAEGLFQLSSELALQVLTSEHEDDGASEPEDDRRALLVRAQDALARGLGLSMGDRRELAERRRAAFAHVLGDEPEEYKQEFRQRQRALAARLASDLSAGVDNGFAAYSTAVAQQRAALPPEVRATLDQALPALLHMQAGRLCGLDPEDERATYVFWARTLDGLAARAKR